jgi:hypothetical protein
MARSTQGADRERRIGPACNRELKRGRKVAKQKGERRVDRLGANHVVVVEDEDERRRELSELVDQRRDDDVDEIGSG